MATTVVPPPPVMPRDMAREAEMDQSVSALTLRVEEVGLRQVGGCDPAGCRGMLVDVVDATVGNVYGERATLSEADLAQVVAILDEAFVQRVQRGWLCPAPTTRPQVEDSPDLGDREPDFAPSDWELSVILPEDAREYLEPIAGCVEQDDPAAKAIFTLLDELASRYRVW